MATKINRRVNVNRYNDSVSIGFYWSEQEGDGKSTCRDKIIRFPLDSHARKIEKAINKLVDRWIHVFFSAFDMSMVSESLDEHPVIFDALVASDHAEDDFLSL